MENNKIILQAKNITKSFRSIKVLKNVSFGIRKSEIAGISGENGSGKSTLLKILVGLMKSDSGNYKIKSRLGYCPQEMLLYERLTVYENFRYFATAYDIRITKENIEELFHNVLNGFNFTICKNKIVSELSGGTKQKLNLAIALINNPGLLILDEPYSGFDWETYLYFWELTERFKSEGKSILIVSHFIHDYKRFDRLFKLSCGELKCE